MKRFPQLPTQYIVRLESGEFLENSTSVGWNYVTTKDAMKAGRFRSHIEALHRVICLGLGGSCEVVPVLADQVPLPGV